MYLTKFRN